MNWTVADAYDWLSLSPSDGATADGTDAVVVSIDWTRIPAGETRQGAVTIASDGGDGEVAVAAVGAAEPVGPYLPPADRIEPRHGDISHVWVIGNRIHHIGPTDTGTGNCDYDAHGLIARVEGHLLSDLVIDGNELHDLYMGTSECLVINGLVERFRVTCNYVHDVNNIAIDIIGYEQNGYETASQGLVADNVMLDASNYWPYCTRGNCAYPVGDESANGIYVDGGAELEIAYNVVGRSDLGLELQSENDELIRDIDVHHNAVFNSNYANWVLGPHQNVNEWANEFFDEAALEDPSFQACR